MKFQLIVLLLPTALCVSPWAAIKNIWWRQNSVAAANDPRPEATTVMNNELFQDAISDCESMKSSHGDSCEDVQASADLPNSALLCPKIKAVPQPQECLTSGSDDAVCGLSRVGRKSIEEEKLKLQAQFLSAFQRDQETLGEEMDYLEEQKRRFQTQRNPSSLTLLKFIPRFEKKIFAFLATRSAGYETCVMSPEPTKSDLQFQIKYQLQLKPFVKRCHLFLAGLAKFRAEVEKKTTLLRDSASSSNSGTEQPLSRRTSMSGGVHSICSDVLNVGGNAKRYVYNDPALFASGVSPILKQDSMRILCQVWQLASYIKWDDFVTCVKDLGGTVETRKGSKNSCMIPTVFAHPRRIDSPHPETSIGLTLVGKIKEMLVKWGFKIENFRQSKQ